MSESRSRSVIAFVLALLALALALGAGAQAPRSEPRLQVQMQHLGRLASLDLSPDGRLAISTGSSDNSVKLWSTESGRLLAGLFTLKTAGEHGGAYFASDGHMVLVADGRAVVRWNTRLNQQAVGWEPPPSLSGVSVGLSISGDRRTLAAYVGFDLYVLDATTLAVRRVIRDAGNWSLKSPQLAVSADGHYAAVRAGSEKELGQRINLWNLQTGQKERAWVAHGKSIAALAFTQDGRALVSAHSGMPVGSAREPPVKVWSVATGELLSTPAIDAESVSDVAIAEQRVAITAEGALNILSAADWQILYRVPIAGDFDGPIQARQRRASSVLVGMLGGGIIEVDPARLSLRPWTRLAYGTQAFALTRGTLVLRHGSSTAWGETVVWDLEGGEPTLLRKEQSEFAHQDGDPFEASSISVSRKGELLAALSPLDREVALYDLKTLRKLRRLSVPQEAAVSQGGKLALSDDGRIVAFLTHDAKSLYVFATDGGRMIRKFSMEQASSAVVAELVVSHDGALIAVVDTMSSRLQVFSTDSGEKLWSLQIPEKDVLAAPLSAAFSPDGHQLAIGTQSRGLRLHEAKSGALSAEIALPANAWHGIRSLTYSLDGSAVYSAMDDGLWHWDLRAKAVVRASGEMGPLRGVSMGTLGSLLSAITLDGSVALWDTGSRSWVARLYQLGRDEREWLVVDAAGRFDAGRLESIDAAHWVLSDRPADALPLESFMREYYEPRLLAKILSGEKLPPVRELRALDRSVPRVAIVAVEPVGGGGLVRVTVEASRGAESGEVHDLKLFRDGQLVAHAPADGGRVTLGTDGRARFTFDDVRIPTASEVVAVVFSAYAFNADRVKSPHNPFVYTPNPPPPQRRGRVYTLHIGVNTHQNAAWNIAYAAVDARRYGAVLNRQLMSGHRYRSMSSVYLVSEDKASGSAPAAPATKGNIRVMLERLAGRAVDPVLLDAIPRARELERATPDDAVIVTFSGHGFTGSDGEFYLIPQDSGPGTTRAESEELRRRSISTSELAEWLRGIDAGELTLILDACQSAASVARDGFRPGPLGSRGLGQLAYEKGMRILAATQADEDAVESGTLRHGILTYVLAREGLEVAAADFRPRDRVIELDEWLRYGLARVPEVYHEVMRGRFIAPRGLEVAPTLASSAKPRGIAQRPILFDFRHG